MLFRKLSLALLALPLVVSACAGVDDGGPSPYDDDFPVSDRESLLGQAPANDSLPDENKADAVYPPLHTDLLAFQSPVKSQGSRGVCSIFSTTALMEHLYLKEGTLTNPDFSEQYMQWSAKFEVRSFPNSSGSNASSNLRAASDFGIVEEAAWPYETQQWGTSKDAACDGTDAQPTRCYTNGEPPASATAAKKFKLPRGRYLSTGSIKAHITAKKTGVVVGMDFFYQSWNHRRSELPVNSAYWREGIVLYPNAKDREISLVKRAGHSILIVGWDDNKEVATVDENGEIVKDANGNPVMEKGFYIFKNSWGTGSFGVANPHGDGYGYLSMRYVNEYGSAYISEVPKLPKEACDDGLDNDENGTTDCDDAACAAFPACLATPTEFTYQNDTSVAIPDNEPLGVATMIDATDAATVGNLKVKVDISHSWSGDLRVTLYHGDRAVVLQDKFGGSDDDIKKTFEVADYNGSELRGEWRLVVVDTAAQDTGTLNSWTLEVLSAQ